MLTTRFYLKFISWTDDSVCQFQFSQRYRWNAMHWRKKKFYKTINYGQNLNIIIACAMVSYDLYVLDCEMPSFCQACSITIPININPQWKIVLQKIPCLCSRERILIAMALRRKIKLAILTKLVTANLKQSWRNSLLK